MKSTLHTLALLSIILAGPAAAQANLKAGQCTPAEKHLLESKVGLLKGLQKMGKDQVKGLCEQVSAAALLLGPQMERITAFLKDAGPILEKHFGIKIDADVLKNFDLKTVEIACKTEAEKGMGAIDGLVEQAQKELNKCSDPI